MIDNAEYLIDKGYNVSIELYRKDGTLGPLLNVNVTGFYKGHFHVCYFDATLYANEDGSLYVKFNRYFPDPNDDIEEILGPYPKGTSNPEVIDNILETIKRYI